MSVKVLLISIKLSPLGLVPVLFYLMWCALVSHIDLSWFFRLLQ